MPKSPVERFQADHNPSDLKNKALWIDYARDDDMKRQMNVIEKKKGVNAILLGIFEEVGAWTSFPTMGVDYLALLLSTHLKRDARFRLTRFLLHNGCNPIRIALWYKTRGMLIDHSARLDVKALLDAFPHPYNPDIKNYHIPGTVSRRTAEPNFERIVDEHRWCTSSLTGGFTYANGIMDDILARAVSILMYNSNAGEAGRFSVPPGDHLSLALGGSTARVEKAIEVYERSRDRFAALLPDDQFCDMNGIVEPEEKLAVRASFIVDGLRKLEAPSEPYDGLKWIVDLAMIPPSPPCSPPYTEITPPASPMRDVEEDPPPLSLPPSALSFLADVSGFKAEFDDRTASLQAAVIAAQKERDGANAELSATIDMLQGKAVQLGVSFDLATSADNRYYHAEKKLAEAKSALTRCYPACKVVVPLHDCLCCCLEDCPARFGCNVKASASTFLSIKTMVGAGRKHSFFTAAEAAAFSRKLASTTAPDHRVHQKLDTIERAVGGMKNKFLDIKARRNGVAFESQFAFTASSAVLSRPL